MLRIEWDGQHFTLRCSNPGSGVRGWKKTGLTPYALFDEIRRVHPDLFNTENEFDLHVWREPETENETAAYTLSIGARGIAHHAPLDDALEALRSDLEEGEEEQRSNKLQSGVDTPEMGERVHFERVSEGTDE